jgi:hypothetical protein
MTVGENTETIDNPMHEAAKRGNTGFLKELLDAGMSVNTLDTAGNTPLHWAARFLPSFLFIIIIIVCTLFMLPIAINRGGHEDCIKMILAKKPVLEVQVFLLFLTFSSSFWSFDTWQASHCSLSPHLAGRTNWETPLFTLPPGVGDLVL